MKTRRSTLLILLVSTIMNAQTLINFKANPTTENWYVVDDVVMGGRSSGKFSLTKDGYGEFSGTISLENNGGFSSVRCTLPSISVHEESVLKIRLKGDGSPYQFRVKDMRKRNYSYTIPFETTGDWQVLEFRLSELYPVFRGRRLDLPNFDHTTLEELTFLIGNKKAQEFRLVLDTIALLPGNPK
ncbi:MAG: CIA30 family protein [Bacteroidota bacterium]